MRQPAVAAARAAGLDGRLVSRQMMHAPPSAAISLLQERNGAEGRRWQSQRTRSTAFQLKSRVPLFLWAFWDSAVSSHGAFWDSAVPDQTRVATSGPSSAGGPSIDRPAPRGARPRRPAGLTFGPRGTWSTSASGVMNRTWRPPAQLRASRLLGFGLGNGLRARPVRVDCV